MRLVHHPSGLVVRVSSGRSQWVNRQAAWTELEARYERQVSEALDGRVNATRARQVGSGDRAEGTWNWCEWRDEVKSPYGKVRMSDALKGKFGKIVR